MGSNPTLSAILGLKCTFQPHFSLFFPLFFIGECQSVFDSDCTGDLAVAVKMGVNICCGSHIGVTETVSFHQRIDQMMTGPGTNRNRDPHTGGKHKNRDNFHRKRYPSENLFHKEADSTVGTVPIDNKGISEVLGTIAGDNTILLILREGFDMNTLMTQLYMLFPSIRML